MTETDLVPVRRALISVSDKTGIEEFARGLTEMGVELLSTGGTFRLLQEAGVPVIRIRNGIGGSRCCSARRTTGRWPGR